MVSPLTHRVAPAHKEIMADRMRVLLFGEFAGMYAFSKDKA